MVMPVKCEKCGVKYSENKVVGRSVFYESKPHICQVNSQQNNNLVNEVQLLDKLEQYFIQYNIKSIERENNKLVIKFNDDNDVNNDILTSEQQQQISSYLQKSNKQTLTLSQIKELKNNSQQQKAPETNYLPWILGGVGIVTVIIGLVWLVNRNKKEK